MVFVVVLVVSSSNHKKALEHQALNYFANLRRPVLNFITNQPNNHHHRHLRFNATTNHSTSQLTSQKPNKDYFFNRLHPTNSNQLQPINRPTNSNQPTDQPTPTNHYHSIGFARHAPAQRGSQGPQASQHPPTLLHPPPSRHQEHHLQNW